MRLEHLIKMDMALRRYINPMYYYCYYYTSVSIHQDVTIYIIS